MISCVKPRLRFVALLGCLSIQLSITALYADTPSLPGATWSDEDSDVKDGSPAPDGLTNGQEVYFGTDPVNPDTDGDHVIDGQDGWPKEQYLSPPRLPEPQYVILDPMKLGIQPDPASSKVDIDYLDDRGGIFWTEWRLPSSDDPDQYARRKKHYFDPVTGNSPLYSDGDEESDLFEANFTWNRSGYSWHIINNGTGPVVEVYKYGVYKHTYPLSLPNSPSDIVFGSEFGAIINDAGGGIVDVSFGPKYIPGATSGTDHWGDVNYVFAEGGTVTQVGTPTYRWYTWSIDPTTELPVYGPTQYVDGKAIEADAAGIDWQGLPVFYGWKIKVDPSTTGPAGYFIGGTNTDQFTETGMIATSFATWGQTTVAFGAAPTVDSQPMFRDLSNTTDRHLQVWNPKSHALEDLIGVGGNTRSEMISPPDYASLYIPDDDPSPQARVHEIIHNGMLVDLDDALAAAKKSNPDADIGNQVTNIIDINNSGCIFIVVDGSKPEMLVTIELSSDKAAKELARKITNPTYFSDYGKTDLGNIYEKSTVPACTVYYKDVVDSNFQVQPFDVDLKFGPGMQGASWSADGNNPTSGTLNGTGPNVKFSNPNKGGVYKFNVVYASKTTLTYLALPLAGGEVKDIVSSDLAKADTFATTVNSNYNVFERNWPPNGLRWFNNGGAGDYLGRPDNTNSRTIWKHNQVDSNGMGAVATWFGYPTRVAKMSNFVVAYAARKIGVTPLSAWVAQVVGDMNDSAAQKSWDAGWAVAGGSSYTSTTSAMTKDIWNKSDDKNQKLWPNSQPVNNYVSRAAFSDVDRQFSPPGFLEMTSP